mmetsp:Transcript_29207/g.82929  ORF Transcript_29207/g.82929 Transcript_29207/m.82929 type:complete len:245 (-) Transcript_29207:1079-1813(-)
MFSATICPKATHPTLAHASSRPALSTAMTKEQLPACKGEAWSLPSFTRTSSGHSLMYPTLAASARRAGPLSVMFSASRSLSFNALSCSARPTRSANNERVSVNREKGANETARSANSRPDIHDSASTHGICSSRTASEWQREPTMSMASSSSILARAASSGTTLGRRRVKFLAISAAGARSFASGTNSLIMLTNAGRPKLSRASSNREWGAAPGFAPPSKVASSRTRRSRTLSSSEAAATMLAM